MSDKMPEGDEKTEMVIRTLIEESLDEDACKAALAWLDERVVCYSAMVELGLVDGTTDMVTQDDLPRSQAPRPVSDSLNRPRNARTKKKSVKKGKRGEGRGGSSSNSG